jgi:hypothetical protein
MPQSQNVRVELLDSRGQLLYTLDGGFKQAGEHHMSIANLPLSSGTFFVQLNVGAKKITQQKIHWVKP